MFETDPYNYQFPQKNQTMYLQTINQQDIGLKKIKIIKEENFSLKTNDIFGANPIIPGYKYNNKETFVNKIHDIERSSPKKLIRSDINRINYNLKNDDIKGSKPQINKFYTTRKSTNPLVPEYKLPYAEIKIATPPKFIRDNININDIEGTRPNPYNFYKFSKHGPPEEIEGSKPKKMFVPKDQINILDVRDINEYLQFKTSRITNPLNPVYVVEDEDGKKIQIGEIDHSKSRRLHPIESKRDPSLDLRTKDIEGACAGSVSEKFLRKNERKDIKHTLKTDDIQGAQVSTLKKGISTSRNLNPIWPFEKYPYLGAKEEALEKEIELQKKTQNEKQSFNKTENKQNDIGFVSLPLPKEEKKIDIVENKENLNKNEIKKEEITPKTHLKKNQTEFFENQPNINIEQEQERFNHILANSASKNILPSREGSKKYSEKSLNEFFGVKLEKDKNKAISTNYEYRKNTNKFFGLSTPSEQSLVVNSVPKKKEDELKNYQGFGESKSNPLKGRNLTKVQHFDQFITK